MSTKDGKATLVHGINKKEIYQLELNVNNQERLEEVVVGCPVKIILIC
jgi:hypothetical protein